MTNCTTALPPVWILVKPMYRKINPVVMTTERDIAGAIKEHRPAMEHMDFHFIKYKAGDPKLVATKIMARPMPASVYHRWQSLPSFMASTILSMANQNQRAIPASTLPRKEFPSQRWTYSAIHCSALHAESDPVSSSDIPAFKWCWVHPCRWMHNRTLSPAS